LRVPMRATAVLTRAAAPWPCFAPALAAHVTLRHTLAATPVQGAAHHDLRHLRERTLQRRLCSSRGVHISQMTAQRRDT
jgi:hypothetical protein